MSNTTIAPAMLEFLRWVASCRRTYVDAMDAWQTSCPRSSVWEDATIAGYVLLRDAADGAIVVLSERGRALIDRAGA